MARKTIIKHARTTTPGLAPAVTDLELGEIAINITDGIAFTKKDDGSEEIVPLGLLQTESSPALSTDLDAAGNTLINIVDPVNLQDAATKNYVDTIIANLVDSAPGTLDTLNELADALGDDPNFAATVSTQLGLKANTADLAAVAFSGDYNDLINIPPSAVTSVNGQTGAVVLGTDDIAEGTTNLYFTETRVANTPEVLANTAKVSADGSIDTHSDVDITTVLPNTGDVLEWDGSNFVPVGIDNGYTIFAIWAEENGGLSDNNRQWSFGNGATGAINIVLPINAELFAVSFDVESVSSGGTCTMEIMKNNTATFVTKPFISKDFETLSTPIEFAAGEYIGFRTDDEVGTFNDARVCAWFRIRTTPETTSVLNDLLDVDVSSPDPDQALVWNGSNFTTQDVILPGDNISELVNDAGFITAAGSPVQNVNGETGSVVLDTDNIGEGSLNLYYTEARVSTNADVVANTAKVSADGSIDTHSDVDVSTSTPNSGDTLVWNGSNFVPGAVGLIQTSYVSPDLPITAGGQITLAHGLSSPPTLIVAQLVCVTGEGGYNAGDIINYQLMQTDKDKKGIAVVPDATDIFVRYGDDSKTFALLQKNDGQQFEITNSNWNVRITAYA